MEQKSTIAITLKMTYLLSNDTNANFVHHEHAKFFKVTKFEILVSENGERWRKILNHDCYRCCFFSLSNEAIANIVQGRTQWHHCECYAR